MIASLAENVSGGKVIGRANFVALVRAWRSNQAALQKAILARMSVSQAETNAFLNAQNKVTSYLQAFMDTSGWLKDAPIPQDVRANVDGTLKNLYGELAEELKDRLNAWDATVNPPEASLFFDTLRAFSAGMQAGDELVEQYRDTMRSIVHGASRVAIGFVPFVGPALDLCEAVTGKEYCMPSGRQLTTGERVFSGIGFGVGKLVKVWGGVKTAAISAEGKATAAGIVNLGEEFAELLAVTRKMSYKTLRGAATTKPLGDFEKVAVRYLVKEEHKMLGFGDDAVREVLGIPKPNSGFPPGLALSCDFLTVTKNDMLVLSEVKGITGGQVDVQKALEQLRNAMKALKEKTLVDGVERVQIFVPKDSGKIFNNELTENAGQLLYKNKPVTLKGQGRPDLIVLVVYL